jgi:CRP-like cAMP-binding protein
MQLYGDKLALVGILPPRVKSLLQEIDFSLAVRNTVLITLVTSLLGIIAVTYWATNRQTQITKSRSQQKLRNRIDSAVDGDTARSQSDSEQDLYFNDFTRADYRRSLIHSIHGDGDDDYDADDRLEASDDEHSDDDEVDAEVGGSGETSKLPRVSPQRKMRKDLFTAISKLEVFSYLSDDSFAACLKLMEYIDLPKTGMDVFQDKLYDGSLYVLLEGKVDIRCGLQSTYEEGRKNLMSLSAGPGDLVTSLLSALCGLIEEYHKSQGTKHGFNFRKIHVRATTLEDNTRLIRIPASAFVSMLKLHPRDVFQITQTIFARCQRVTIQTLVNNLGLGYEILYSHGNNTDELPSNCKETATSNLNAKEEEDKRKEVALIVKEILKANGKNAAKDHTAALDVNVEIMERIATVLSHSLGSTSPSAIATIKKESSVAIVKPGEVILASESKSNYVYFVLDGSITVCSNVEEERGIKSNSNSDTAADPFRQLYKVLPGDIAGQMSCFTDEVSFVTLRSSTEIQNPTLLVQLPKQTFRSLLDIYPEVLIGCISKILTVDFSPLVHLFEWGVDWMHVQAGTSLATKGEICDKLQVVLSGRLQATPSTNRNYKTAVKNEDEYGRGSCIGEALVILGAKWPNDVYAIRNSEIAVLPVNVIEYIMHMFPHTAVYIAKRIAAQQVQHKRRHRKATRSFSFHQNELSVATLAIVPLCFDSAHEAHDLCAHITGALGKIEPCTLMTKSLARKHVGNKVFKLRNAVHQLKISRLLGDLEEGQPLTVYETDSKFTWWTKLCIQQADCVILVIDGKKVSSCTNLERYLAWAYDKRLVRHVQVLLLQQVTLSGEKPPSEIRVPLSHDVSAWIESRHFIEGQHLVRKPVKSYENDVARMCRRITGRSLGLALGGGGARGKFPRRAIRINVTHQQLP